MRFSGKAYSPAEGRIFPDANLQSTNNIMTNCWVEMKNMEEFGGEMQKGPSQPVLDRLTNRLTAHGAQKPWPPPTFIHQTIIKLCINDAMRPYTCARTPAH